MNEKGRKWEPPKTKFGEELQNYLRKKGKTYKSFAREIGVVPCAITTWVRGESCNEKGWHKNYPDYKNLLRMVGAGHGEFVFKCLQEGVL